MQVFSRCLIDLIQMQILSSKYFIFSTASLSTFLNKIIFIIN